MSINRWMTVFGLLLVFGLSNKVSATFSIVACERDTGRCGVAVATHNLAVGNSVPFARAKVGAGVSQFETNPIHGPLLLGALAAGVSAEQALEKALREDAQFADGNNPRFRQIAVVGLNGGSAAYTGQAAAVYSGHRAGDLLSVQGNGLVSVRVLDAMWNGFENSAGSSLPERLLSALEQGYAAGGQTIGVTSAALLVATPEGWPVDTDLRVDFDSGEAIDKLRKAFDASVARQCLFQARQHYAEGDSSGSEALTRKALEKAPDWDRVWLNAARLAKQANNPEALRQRFCRFRQLNPVWANSIADQFDSVVCE